MKTMTLKNSIKTAVLTSLLTLSLSCSKDEDPVVVLPTPIVAEQNPLAGYLAASGFNQSFTNFVNDTDYEFGFSFIPLVNGKMTAIVAKIPDAHLAMRVTIWDKVAGTVIRTEIMDITTAGVEVTKVITALDLVMNKEYFITFNSNDYYNYRRTDNANVTYPFTVGDIRITSYSYRTGTNQEMPNIPQFGYYGGDLSFKFQKS
jgi:hypothetical protein